MYIPLLGKILQDWEAAEEEEEEDDAAMNVDNENDSECCTGDHSNHHHNHHHHQEGALHIGSNGNHGYGAAAATPPLPAMTAQEILSKCECLGRDFGIFSAMDGTALLSLVCCMNHSCAPNCEVRWVGGLHGEPVLAELIAIQPIAVGEELCQSYIKVELPLEDRRQALKDYGFICACPKCRHESM